MQSIYKVGHATGHMSTPLKTILEQKNKAAIIYRAAAKLSSTFKALPNI